MSFVEKIKRISEIIAAAPPPTTAVINLPSGSVNPPFEAGAKISREVDYFTITINEMYLTKGREFWSTYDPLVFVSVDFIYGGQKINVPALIGPNALKEKQELPHGFIINDIRVVGPHPFRGGSVSLSVILYKVRNKDYAKRVLQFAEGVTKAISVPAGIELVTKVGGTLLDAFETLVSMGDSVPVTGHRVEIDGNTTRGFASQYTALLASNNQEGEKLTVSDSRLLDGRGQPYRDNDYVLYSISRNEFRNEESTLPFYSMVDEINKAALSNDAESWSRAKAELITLYQKMLSSPDLTTREADLLFEKYKQTMFDLRKRAELVGMMSNDSKGIKPEGTAKLDRLVQDLEQL